MKKIKLFAAVVAAMIYGNVSAQTITASDVEIEAGGTAAAYGGNSNVVVGTAQKTNWTIEAISKEAGFMSTRTFQVEVKKRLGITPSQFRLNNNPQLTQNVNDAQQEKEYLPKKRGRKPKGNNQSGE